MTVRDKLLNDYFEWMCNLVCGRRFAKSISYRKLLMTLHATEFIYSIPRDENRAENGMDLRYRYVMSLNCEHMLSYLDGPCTVLEMMVALAIKCEENIMDDPRYGDRTGQWFWGMVNNLGLGSMYDTRFDKEYVESVLKRFLYREYEPNGKGGLFTIRNCDSDLRNVEIWHQLCWYLDSISDF